MAGRRHRVEHIVRVARRVGQCGCIVLPYVAIARHLGRGDERSGLIGCHADLTRAVQEELGDRKRVDGQLARGGEAARAAVGIHHGQGHCPLRAVHVTVGMGHVLLIPCLPVTEVPGIGAAREVGVEVELFLGTVGSAAGGEYLQVR